MSDERRSSVVLDAPLRQVSRAEAAVSELLQALGEDPNREGLRETPRRVAAAFAEMTAGHSVDIAKLLAVTFDGGSYDAMIAVTDIPFVSLCEHHLLPFSGHVNVVYLPGASLTRGYRVVGLSKIPRLVDAFAQRLQMQEQMTVQIASALEEHLQPRGVAVGAIASHSCMSCRGVRKAGVLMRTSALHGLFLTSPMAKAEVMTCLWPHSK